MTRATAQERQLPGWFIWTVYLLCASLGGAGLLAKIPLVQYAIPLPAWLLSSLAAVGIVTPCLAGLALRIRKPLAVIAVLGTILVSLFLSPRVHALHGMGRGDDQPDCIVAASEAMLHGHWPYDHHLLWSQSPMSCGAGWVIPQAPFVRFGGYWAAQLAVLGASIATLFAVEGFEITTGVLALLLLPSGYWLAVANGTDFLTFGMAAAAFAAWCMRHDRPGAGGFVTGVVLAQFRAATLLLPLFTAKRTAQGWATAAATVALLCELAFLLWNTSLYISDGPLWITRKLFTLSLFSANRGAAIMTFVALGIAAILLGVIATAMLRLRSEYGALLYLLGVIFIPALGTFAHDYAASHSFTAVLQEWGAVYMTGCLPLAALSVVRLCNSSADASALL